MGAVSSSIGKKLSTRNLLERDVLRRAQRRDGGEEPPPFRIACVADFPSQFKSIIEPGTTRFRLRRFAPRFGRCRGVLVIVRDGIGGSVVPQSASSRWLIALRLCHGRAAIADRSASAYPLAYRGTPQACWGFHQAAFGSFVLSRALADPLIPVGSHRQAGNSGGTRTVARHRTA